MVDITVIVGHGVMESAYDYEFSCSYCANGRNCYVDTGNLNPFVRDVMQRMDEVFYPHEFSKENNSNTQSLYIVHRFDILPRITYRKAL